jgi:hypothetical protein
LGTFLYIFISIQPRIEYVRDFGIEDWFYPDDSFPFCTCPSGCKLTVANIANRYPWYRTAGLDYEADL